MSYVLPATHFMGLIKTLFLAGNDWPTILRSSAILCGYALALAWATRRTLKKQLD